MDQTIINNLYKKNSKGIKVNFINEQNLIKKLAFYTKFSIKKIYKRKNFRKELSQYINSNYSSRKEGIPGYSLKLPDFISLLFPFVLRYIDLSFLVAHLNYKSILSMPLACVISTNKDNKRSWLDVGRTTEGIILEAISRGLSVYITVAAIDDPASNSKVREMSLNSFKPQFMFFMGYSSLQKSFSPRMGLANKIII